MDAKTTGIVAYFTWIGWIVALCLGDKEGAQFHMNQSLVVLLGLTLTAVVGWIPIIGWLYGILMIVCWVIGLIYACQGEEKEIPVLGQIKILK